MSLACLPCTKSKGIFGTVRKERGTMNPYQIMGIIAVCTAFFVGVISLLLMQGVHILLAFLGVYVFAVLLMLGMQRRAKDCFELKEDLKLRKGQRYSQMHSASAREFQKWGQFSTNA